MPNLRQTLLAGETLSFHTKKSLIIFFMPLLWTGITLLFFYRAPQFSTGISALPLLDNFATLAWIPGLAALYSWINQGLNYLTSDFIVTNQRVIMREGFFFRHATETRLSAIAEIKIDQSLLGQMFNFGTITVNSFGGGAEIFDSIRSPYEFQRSVSEITNKTGNSSIPSA